MATRSRAVLVLLALLVLAACGGEPEPASPPAQTPEQTASQDQTAEASAPSVPRSPAPSTSPPQETASESEAGTVLLPPEGQPGSLSAMAQLPAAEAISTSPVLTSLSTAIEVADLTDTLNGAGPFTILAPVDDAFAAVPQDDLDALLSDTGALTDLLTYHVVRGEALSAADLGDRTQVEMANGGVVMLAPDGEGVELNGGEARVLLADIQVANGIVHMVDGVLMRP